MTQPNDHSRSPLNATIQAAWARYIETTSFAVLIGTSSLAIFFALYASALRLYYPFDLEWCEGAMVDVVRRVLEGKAIFASPSVEYTSHEYTPFFYYVGAAVSACTGVGVFALRLVSMAAFVGTLACIALCTWRETRGRVWPFVAAGLYAALFEVVYGWFTIARVDSLFMCFFFAAIAILRSGQLGHARATIAGLFIFLAFFTKQSTLMMIAPLAAYLFLKNWRVGITLGLSIALPVILSTLVLSLTTGGWYWYYVVNLLGQQKRVPEMLSGFWTQDLLNNLPIALAFTLALLTAPIVAAASCRRLSARALASRLLQSDLFWPALALGVFVGCWMSRMHEGSWINSDMPVFALLAILSTTAAHQFVSWAATSGETRRAVALACVTFLLTAQFWSLRYDPWRLIPTEADRAAAQHVADVLRSVDGEVFMPFQGNLLGISGKTSYANGISTWDLLRGTDTPLHNQLREDFRRAFAEGRFSVVIISSGYLDLYPIAESGNYTELPVRVIPWEINRWPGVVFCRKDLTATAAQLVQALGKP